MCPAPRAAYGGPVTSRQASRRIGMRGLSIVIVIILVASACAGQGGTPSSAAAPTADPTEATAAEASPTAAAPTAVGGATVTYPATSRSPRGDPDGNGPRARRDGGHGLGRRPQVGPPEPHRPDPQRRGRPTGRCADPLRCGCPAPGSSGPRRPPSNRGHEGYCGSASGDVLGPISLRDACRRRRGRQ